MSRRKRQTGKPDRFVYEITPTGSDVLRSWLESPATGPAPREAFLLHLYFGSSLDDGDVLTVLEVERGRHQKNLDELRDGAARVAADDSVSDRTAVLRQTAFEGAIARERSLVDWLDDCIDAVRDGALPGSGSAGSGQRQLFGR